MSDTPKDSHPDADTPSVQTEKGIPHHVDEGGYRIADEPYQPPKKGPSAAERSEANWSESVKPNAVSGALPSEVADLKVARDAVKSAASKESLMGGETYFVAAHSFPNGMRSGGEVVRPISPKHHDKPLSELFEGEKIGDVGFFKHRIDVDGNTTLLEPLHDAVAFSHEIDASKSVSEVFESAVGGKIGKEKTFVEALERAPRGDKIGVALTAAFAAISLAHCAMLAPHIRERDSATQEKHTNWNALTWSAVEAALGGLMAFSALETGKAMTAQYSFNR